MSLFIFINIDHMFLFWIFMAIDLKEKQARGLLSLPLSKVLIYLTLSNFRCAHKLTHGPNKLSSTLSLAPFILIFLLCGGFFNH